VRDTGGGVEVALDGRVFHWTLGEDSPGAFVARGNGKTVRFHLARNGDAVHLFWNGVVYALTLEREGSRASRRSDAGDLEAPMPGRVTAVKVLVGDAVERGQELVVVEAMKMENALRAPVAGTVRAVHASVGEMVAPGRALVEIEAEP